MQKASNHLTLEKNTNNSYIGTFEFNESKFHITCDINDISLNSKLLLEDSSSNLESLWEGSLSRRHPETNRLLQKEDLLKEAPSFIRNALIDEGVGPLVISFQ